MHYFTKIRFSLFTRFSLFVFIEQTLSAYYVQEKNMWKEKVVHRILNRLPTWVDSFQRFSLWNSLDSLFRKPMSSTVDKRTGCLKIAKSNQYHGWLHWDRRKHSFTASRGHLHRKSLFSKPFIQLTILEHQLCAQNVVDVWGIENKKGETSYPSSKK